MTETNEKPKMPVQGLGPIVYSIELRDIFAAHALEHALNNMINIVASEMARTGYPPSKDVFQDLMDQATRNAYAAADSMLRARDVKHEK